MALVTITELFTPRTKDEIEDSILAVAASLGLSTTAWQTGGVVRTVVSSIAQVVSTFTDGIAEIAKGGFLDYAPDGWIDILASSVYGVTRIPATYATGTVTLTNASGAPYTLAAGDLHVAHATSGKTYKNQAGFTLNASSSLVVAIEADEAGTASNAGVGTITVRVTSLIGVTSTNAAAVLGADRETNTQLALRCREKLGALSPNGPKEAYNYFAKSAATSAPITRAKTVLTVTTGYVNVYVATASGGATAPDVAIVDADIQALAVPIGVTAITAAAANLSIDVTCTVWLSGSAMTVAEIQALVSAKISEYFATLPIGGFDIMGIGYVFNNAILDQIFAADTHIVQASISLPASDTVVASNEVPVVGTVSVGVNMT